MKTIVISQHALDRYRERFGIRHRLDSTLVDRLRAYWRAGDMIDRPSSAMVMEFLSHGSIGEWRHYRGVIMIVSAGVMVTVIRRSKNHKPMFTKPKRSRRWQR